MSSFSLDEAREILQKYYGYPTFRPVQEKIIRSLSTGKETLAIMPTGGGKSICYQVPALMLPGITLVVSPLISLMKDQVDALKQQGIPATFLNSSLSPAEKSKVFDDIMDNKYKLVYIAPERLLFSNFLHIVRAVRISFIAVDEAHCISQWGHDFRPSYLQIKDFLQELPQRPLLGAFTATATAEVRSDIVNLLELRDPAVHIAGFDRPNLHFSVMSGVDKDDFLLKYIGKHRDEFGIVYAATRKDVNVLTRVLQNNGIAAAGYHAGMSDGARKQAQDDFIYDNVQVIVATLAFGMGIDKSNVRYVIHYNMPKNIESYYQEAGRAGRDGEPSECILLFDPRDIQTQRWFIDHSTEGQEKDEARMVKELQALQKMTDYCNTVECLRGFILRYFGEDDAPNNCHNCSNCQNNRPLMDLTLEAQKIFSCVYRMHQNYGISMVTKVLVGSKERRVKELNFDRLSTYGIMKEKSQQEIKLLIQRFIAADYMETVGEMPILRLKPSAFDVMKGKIKVLQRTDPKVSSQAYSSDLLVALRDLRKKIANREGVASYMIFSDKTLRDMCQVRPQNLREMLKVNGIGQMKLERYGEEFLNCLLKNQ